MGKHGLSVQERIENRIDMSTSDCWLWLGSVTSRGYGNIGVEGKTKSVHRVYWEALNGPAPEDMFVCHTCDVPICVNPEHLFLGTRLDNTQDMVNKGRAANLKLTHCKRGHLLGKAQSKKVRRCKLCARQRSLDSYHRRK